MRKPDKLTIILGAVFAVIFVISGYKLLEYGLQYRNQKELNQQLVNLRQQSIGISQENLITDVNPVVEDGTSSTQEEKVDYARIAEKFREINEDYVFFLSIPDTDVAYPVVYRDNSYYLTHDFTGELNRHGAVFLDERCAMEDSFLLLHGHRMKDGTMFGPLKNYKEKEFRESHTLVCLDFGMGDVEYEVFAVCMVDLEKADFFQFYELPKEEEAVKKYMDNLKSNALWYQTPDYEEGILGESAQVVILSTCENGVTEKRLLVAAIKK